MAALSDAGVARNTVDAVIEIDGRRLDSGAMARIQELSIVRALNEAGQLTLRLSAWDSDREALVWVDDDVFTAGRTIDVAMGEAGRTAPLFRGEIVSLDLEVGVEGRAVLTVTAYDVLHRLGRGRRSGAYLEKTYADIVRDLCRTHYSLAVNADKDLGRDPVRPVVHQENQSDLDFVLGLARQLDYELFAHAGKLVFRRSRLGESPTIVLDLARDLVSFSAHLAAASQLGGVDVFAFDTDAKERIHAGANNPDAADRAFRTRATRAVILDDAVTSEAHARARARAELARIRGGYLEATATTFGRPDLAAGTMVRINDLGRRFSGAYYVTSASHRLSAGNGLRTTLALKGLPR